MNYISTRNNQKNFTFRDVFLKGLADDGGLFVPQSIKKFKKEELDNLKNLSYNDLAVEIIYPFIGDFMSKDNLISMISKSYTNNPEAIQTGPQRDPKTWAGRFRRGKKTRGTFLKDSSVSHCVLAGYLFSRVTLV